MSKSEEFLSNAERSIETIYTGIVSIDRLARENNTIINGHGGLKDKINKLIARQKVIIGYNLLITILLGYIILKLIFNI
jgi:hypothetical protein